MGFSEEQMTRLKGQLRVKNISGSLLTLTQYGAYEFEIDEELDLIASTTPDTLRAADYSTAKNMIGRATVGKSPQYTNYELAAKIEAEDLEVSKDVRPDLSMLKEKPAG